MKHSVMCPCPACVDKRWVASDLDVEWDPAIRRVYEYDEPSAEEMEEHEERKRLRLQLYD